MSRVSKVLIPLLVAAAVTACSSTAEYPRASARTTVVVTNVNTTLGSVQVHLETPTGYRVRLGAVAGNQARSFEVRRPLRPGDYRLEARGVRTLVSRPFRLEAGDVVEWQLRLNRVRLRGRNTST
jgi:hypothetical protein